MAGPNPSQFAAAVLKGIGAPVTPKNVNAFIGWSQAEGPLASSNWQRNNPLNTTDPTGAVGGAFNSAGVRAYPNFNTGVHATVKTLTNGFYGGIVNAFKRDNPTAAPVSELNTWGTGAAALQTMGKAIGSNSFGVPKGIPQMPQSAGGRASSRGPSSLNLSLEQPVQKQAFDQQGFQQAQRLYTLRQFLSNQTNPFEPKVPGMPKAQNPLLSSGVLPTAAPSVADFTSAQTVLQKVAGHIPLNTHPALHAGPSTSGGVTRGRGDFATPVPQKIVDTQNFAKTVSALGAPYSQANHAASFSQGLALIKKYGTDCSGLVSLLLGPRGAGVLSSPQTTDTIESQPGIQPGRGAHITMWNRPYVGGNSHIFMQIGKDWFESGGNAGGVRQISNAEASQELAKGGFHPLHPRGF